MINHANFSSFLVRIGGDVSKCYIGSVQETSELLRRRVLRYFFADRSNISVWKLVPVEFFKYEL